MEGRSAWRTKGPRFVTKPAEPWTREEELTDPGRELNLPFHIQLALTSYETYKCSIMELTICEHPSSEWHKVRVVKVKFNVDSHRFKRAIPSSACSGEKVASPQLPLPFCNKLGNTSHEI